MDSAESEPEWLAHPTDRAGRKISGVWFGVCPELEVEADRIIFGHLRNLRHSDKTDILTPWKMRDRLRREVSVGPTPGTDRQAPSEGTLPTDGTPDRALVQGIFGRKVNPLHSHLNGHPRGVRAGDGHEPLFGVGQVYGRSLNTPSLWVETKERPVSVRHLD